MTTRADRATGMQPILIATSSDGYPSPVPSPARTSPTMSCHGHEPREKPASESPLVVILPVSQQENRNPRIDARARTGLFRQRILAGYRGPAVCIIMRDVRAAGSAGAGAGRSGIRLIAFIEGRGLPGQMLKGSENLS